jgi:Response regulator containing a CheY-like receiver domain and an HTH DNA-binding domain
MKILFVEDENIKRRDIMNYLSTDLNINDIDVVHSLMGGMLALKKKNYKMVLLDMSLPLYDINGEDEEINEFEAFGGIEILDEIERKELDVKVLVITAFDVIEDDTKKIRLDQLDNQMKENYARFYLGCIHYDQSSLEWKYELKKYLKENYK